MSWLSRIFPPQSGLWPPAVPEFLVPEESQLPAELLISIPAGWSWKDFDWLEPGTVITQGQPLAKSAPQSAAVPLAPITGVIGESAAVTLGDGGATIALTLYLLRTPTAAAAGSDPPPQWPIAADPNRLAAWLDYLRRCGVAAYRHNSPDLIGQLVLALNRPIDAIICTTLDTDVALRLAAGVAARFSEDLIRGVRLLADIVGATQRLIVVESGASACWDRELRQMASKDCITVVSLLNDYPQADPTLLLHTLLGRRLRPGILPAEQGAIVLDAMAAVAVGRAAAGQEMTHVPMGIHDHLRGRSNFLLAPVGMRMSDALRCAAIPDGGYTLRGGDLLRDVQLSGDAVISASELAIHLTPPESPGPVSSCIRCGWCVDICPTRVQPAAILDALQTDRPAIARSAGIHACIECGLCSHVCPVYLPLLPAIRQMRQRHFVTTRP